MLKKIHGSWLWYVSPKSCLYNMMSKKITLWGGGAMVKDLIPQYEGEEFKSPHLQPSLPWLLQWLN
jgi:hypothetical protein